MPFDWRPRALLLWRIRFLCLRWRWELSFRSPPVFASLEEEKTYLNKTRRTGKEELRNVSPSRTPASSATTRFLRNRTCLSDFSFPQSFTASRWSASDEQEATFRSQRCGLQSTMMYNKPRHVPGRFRAVSGPSKRFWTFPSEVGGGTKYQETRAYAWASDTHDQAMASGVFRVVRHSRLCIEASFYRYGKKTSGQLPGFQEAAVLQNRSKMHAQCLSNSGTQPW